MLKKYPILLQLALERSGVESMPPTRPTSLFLEETSDMLLHEDQEQNNNELKTSKKKKKRRATDNRQKTFDGRYIQMYVPAALMMSKLTITLKAFVAKNSCGSRHLK